MNIFKNYAFTIYLIIGIVIGGISGLVFGEKASIVKPIGELFLNMMFVLIVPLVFLSVSSAIYNMKKMNLIVKANPLVRKLKRKRVEYLVVRLIQ